MKIRDLAPKEKNRLRDISLRLENLYRMLPRVKESYRSAERTLVAAQSEIRALEEERATLSQGQLILD